MELRRLEEFSVLAEAKSFRAAAAALGISPALLSARIAALEKKLGVKLLERSAHGLALTEAGKCFLPDAREIAADYARILRRMEGMSRQVYRSIRIGLPGFTMPAKLGPYLDSVNLRHPNIHLELLDDNRCDIEEGLRSEAVDVFFSFAPEGLEFAGVRKELAYTTRVQVLVPAGHRLAERSSIAAAELAGECFVLYPQTEVPAMRAAEVELLNRTGIPYSVYDGFVSAAATYGMVPIGKGLALCPWLLRHMIYPNTTALAVEDPGFVMNMYLFYSEQSENPYLPEFLEGFRRFEMGGAEQ